MATFVTYYNAIHRGKTEFFSKRYTKTVNEYLSKNVGISRFFYEWPGKTEIVIPITRTITKKEKTSTREISSKEIIKELKKTEDKGLTERKEIVEIKKKEIKEEKQEMEIIKKALKEKEENIKKKNENLQKVKEKLKEINNEEEQKEIAKEEKQLDMIKEELKKEIEEIQKTEENIKRKEAEIKEEEKEIKKEELKQLIKKEPEKALESLEEKLEGIYQKEKEIETKEKILKKIEEEQQSTKAGDKIIFLGKMYYLKRQYFTPEGHYNNEMYLVDPINKKIILKSEFTNICGTKYTIFGDGVVVIGFEKPQIHDYHFLVLLDSENLKVKIRGSDNIFWRSFVEFKDNYIYSVVIKEKKYYLGKFNKELKLIAQSDIEVDKDTFISFFENKIYLSSTDKTSITVLEESNLKKIDLIKF